MSAPEQFEQMWEQQRQFMVLLKEKRGFVEFPVDMHSKEGQQACREAGLSGVEEWFEALKHLKNWKKHRATEVKELDKDAFLEEMSDSMHYFLEVLLLAGVDADEFFDIYMRKGELNAKRINEGY
jgi:hypothetical protein